MAFDSNIKGYMTFGKSFSRGGAFPLEAYEIWTDYDALVAYAANTNPDKDPSYIGQKVAFVDKVNNKVTHYGIEIDGSLKELGATPIGDEKSIVVDETDYTISLKGVDGLVFERDILGEDGEPTGEKEEVKFQPLMTKDGLVWVEPSKTTVEGLATLLSELTVRVKALEDDRVTEQELADAVAALEEKIEAVDFVDEDELAEAIKDFATDEEVAAAVATEKERAEAAEKALGERIDAIDFVDADELATALEPYAKAADVNKTLEDYAKTADVNAALADKADKSAYDQTVIDLDALEARVSAFLDNTGAATDAIDTLQELLEYIESHDDVDIAGIMEDIQAIEQKLTLGTYVDGEETKEYATVKAYVEAVIEALNVAQYAKTSDLSDLSDRVDEVDGKFASYTNTEALTELLAGKQNVIPENTYDAYGAAAAAREGAVADVAAVGYALAANVVANDTFEEFKTVNSKAIEDAVAAHEEAVSGTYATKAELEAHVEAAEAAYATKDELEATDDVAKDAQNRVGIVEGKIDEITSVGGEPNVIEKIKVNGVTLEVEKDAEGKSTKTVSIAVPTSITTMDGYADLNTRVTTNANGIAALEGQLANTNTNVSGNTTEIGKINTEITTDLKPRIEALEGADKIIEGVIAGHTTAIQSLNETTIPALQGAIEAEAKARDNADKAILTKIGDVATGKTVVDLINEVAGTIDFTPYATNARVDAIYKVEGETETGVLAKEIARAKAAEQVNAEAIASLTNGAVKKNTEDIAAINALLNTVDSEDTITSLKELAIWVEEHETEVLPVIEDQGKRLAEAEAILAGIGGEGEKATVKSYVDDAIAAIPAYELPVATVAALGGIKSAADVEGNTAVNKVYVDATTGVGEVKAFSTDNLVQGSLTLILSCGNVDVSAE